KGATSRSACGRRHSCTWRPSSRTTCCDWRSWTAGAVSSLRRRRPATHCTNACAITKCGPTRTPLRGPPRLSPRTTSNADMARHYLLYGSERYALAILRPVQEAIRARGDEAAWFFDGPGAEDLFADERLLDADGVRAWNPIAVITPSNAVPHFFPGVKVETFHGFDAGKPRHIYIRGF